MSQSPKTKAKTQSDLLRLRLVGGNISQMATYADLFERLTDLIFLIDPKSFEILEYNPSVRSFLKSEPERLVGQSILECIKSVDHQKLEDHLNESSQSLGSTQPIDVVFKKSDSHPVFELTACRLKLGDYGEVLQLIAKDVTAIRQATRDLANLARTDAMTGLFNFRHFQESLTSEFERSVRSQSPMSVIICDVDHFKHYNDTNGHPEGDQALKVVAKTLRSRVRAIDILARYGGEEFAVICPNTTAKQAITLAEALRSQIESATFKFGTKQPLGKVTLSLGVASLEFNNANAQEKQTPALIVEAADQALYQAKQSGRNRVGHLGQASHQKIRKLRK